MDDLRETPIKEQIFNFIFITSIIIGSISFMLGNVFYLVRSSQMQDELIRIREYAAQSEFNSRSCIKEIRK